MKKTGLLHGQLSRVIAEMGHKDAILIADAGMPIPKNMECIDLALTKGIPGFLEVLRAISLELEVEEYILAEETRQVSPHIKEGISSLVGEQVKYKELSHEELKEISKTCKACIRTGEFTPYANIILKAGVVF